MLGCEPIEIGSIVENIDWQYLLFQFDGRINRAKFWAGLVATWVISVAAWILLAIGISIDSSGVWVLVGIIAIGLYVAIIWMGLAVSIKRWHDRGKSGWWIFIGLIPLIGGIWALIETGFLLGDRGDNQYGPDPLASI